MEWKEKVIEGLTAVLGAPARVTKKVTAFEVPGRFGIVVQTDQPPHAGFAYAWVPDLVAGLSGIKSERYAAGKGRHSNTYGSTGLERGKAATRLTIKDDRSLGDLLAVVGKR